MNRKRRETWFIIKCIQFLLSFLIVLCTVAAFLNSVKYRIMIPTALTMAAMINLMNGIVRLSEHENMNHVRERGVAGVLAGAILAAIAVAGFVTL